MGEQPTDVLKPCPFCGHKDISVYEKVDGCWGLGFEVSCEICEATVAGPIRMTGDLEAAKPELRRNAISLWNSRELPQDE